MRELALIVVVVLGVCAQAQAQERPVVLNGRAVLLSPYDQSVFNMAAAESDIATALYVTTAVSAGLAVVSLFGAGSMFLGHLFGGNYGLSTTEMFLVGAATLGSLAVVALPLAIALDVDAGSRRRGLARRYRVDLSVMPTGLGLRGAF